MMPYITQLSRTLNNIELKSAEICSCCRFFSPSSFLISEQIVYFYITQLTLVNNNEDDYDYSYDDEDDDDDDFMTE